MSMVVLRTPFQLDNYCTPEPEEQFQTKDEAVVAMEDDEDHPAQSDIWSAIQAQKTAANPADASPAAPPYVHPLVRRASSSMSQESLLICTESLGSETGSDDFSAILDELDVEDYLAKIETDKEEENHDYLVMKGETWPETEKGQRKRQEIASVNYHCSINKRSPPRSFPPPLPSICCRNAPCLQMRPRRRDGRLVLDAVPAPSQNYLQAQREGGRLLLSFIDATLAVANFDGASSDSIEIEHPREQHQPIDENWDQTTTEMEAEEIEAFEQVLDDDEEEEEEEEEDEEEEVEVVDRGTVVEVKVSTQPQQQSGGAMKVLRSSLVINKFVGGTPISSNPKCELPPPENEEIPNQMQTASTSRRPPPTTATAAAAVVVASSTIRATAEAYNEQGYGGGARLADGEDDSRHLALENKMLFTSTRRNREKLLHSVRRCSQLRRPLFIWEPYCIAT